LLPTCRTRSLGRTPSDEDQCSVTPESFPFRQTGFGVTVIGGMNFLVVAPEPSVPDECNGREAADVR
jgi:hypothetical protein